MKSIKSTILAVGLFAWSGVPALCAEEAVWYENSGTQPVKIFEIRAADDKAVPGYIQRNNKNGEKLFVAESVLLTNSDVARARVSRNDWSGAPQYGLEIELTPDGGEKFSKFTEERIGKRVALLIDDVVYSAPTVLDKILGRKLTLMGEPTSELEANELAKEIVGIRGNK